MAKSDEHGLAATGMWVRADAGSSGAGGVDGPGLIAEQTRRDLHALAGQLLRGERANHTLQPTALLSEMWLRLLVQDGLEFETEAAFWAWASKTMRHILVDYARRRRAQKRGGGRRAGELPDVVGAVGVDLLELDDALKRLEQEHPRSARVAEMRFFGGMTEVMIAQRLGVSDRTVRSDWRMARVWLHRALCGEHRTGEESGSGPGTRPDRAAENGAATW